MLVVMVCLVLLQTWALAQTLGTAPQFDRAVQGQTGAQPEGAFFNIINCVGNVIAPVGAVGAVVGGRVLDPVSTAALVPELRSPSTNSAAPTRTTTATTCGTG